MCVCALSFRTWTVLSSLRAVISSTLAVWRNGSTSRRRAPSVTRSSRANHQPPLSPTKTPLWPIRALQSRTKPIRSRKMAHFQMMGRRGEQESRRDIMDLTCQLEKPPPPRLLVCPLLPTTWRLHHHLPLLLLPHLWLNLRTSCPQIIPRHLPPTHRPRPPPTLTTRPHRLNLSPPLS